MSRLLRFSLWGLALFVVAVGATLFWVESQLQAEPLGRRVKDLLADAGIKGGITRVEASLDGSFSAEGIDLTLADGTKIAAASVKGDAHLFAILRGTYALGSLEVKALDVDLGSRVPPTKPAATAVGTPAKPTLPAIALGPYAASGRVKLADFGVADAPAFVTVKVEPPPQRQKGIMVKDVAELVDALKKKGLV